MRTCLPLYDPTPIDPDALARSVSDQMSRFTSSGRRPLRATGRANSIYPMPHAHPRRRTRSTPVRDHQEMAAAIQVPRLQVFAGAGHGVFRDKPNEAQAVIDDFIHS
jgi:pimeloyl-ACP methyl ester carboxylesterase